MSRRGLSRPAPGRAPTLLDSFNYAFEGIIHVLRTQRNMRIHFLAAILVLVLAIAIGVQEFELLALLLDNAGRVLTRDTLIDRVWGSDYVGDTKTLDVHVKRLRAKVEADPGAPKHLVTVRGLGYKFEAPR